MKCTISRQTGLWLFSGGGVLLAATWFAAHSTPGVAADAAALRLGLVGGSLLLGMGLMLLTRFHGRPQLSPGPRPLDRPTPIESADKPAHRRENPCEMPADLVREMEDWLGHTPPGPDVWTAFDQFAREMLARHANTRWVRCFEVMGAGDRLRHRSLSDASRTFGEPENASGLLAEAVRGQRPCFADDRPASGPTPASADTWAIAWPVRDGATVIGVIGVGEFGDGGSAALARTTTVLAYLGLFWRFVALRERLETARITDRRTGVLNRDEFFAKARHAARESHEQGEPLAVAALVLEGLRGLDDKGLWAIRDALVEEVGRALLGKLRSDDVVGRLADDRFVFLMRRIDDTLGRLIAHNIMEDVDKRIRQRTEFDGRVGVRMGLAGGNLRPATLDALLADAWRAVETARHRGEPLHACSGDSPQPGGRP